MTQVGVIETGGTSTRVAIADCAPDAAIGAAAPAAARMGVGRLPRLLARETFATGDPATTLAKVAAWFRGSELTAIGVAAFGPLELRRDARDHGSLLATPKPGWSRYPLRHALEHALALPVAIDTDVGAAALGEQAAARDVATLAYVTVGTGIGVGLAIDGAIHHGALHPEAGHLRVARAAGDRFAGLCPFHGDCLEGLASGPALAARAGGDPATLPPDSAALRDALAIEADYLAQLVLAIIGLVAPHRLVLGGGVLRAPGLLAAVRVRAVERAAGYSPLIADAVCAERLLLPPGCGSDSALIGAALLAADAPRRCAHG
ncbi:MAG: ROK family protein [Planctomycetes bacterium]|nr:ROK family protein [Planctomycetota bacterium]